MVETVHLLGGDCEKEGENMGAETFECEVEIEIPKSLDVDPEELEDPEDLDPEECVENEYFYWVDGDEVSGHCRKKPYEELW